MSPSTIRTVAPKARIRSTLYGFAVLPATTVVGIWRLRPRHLAPVQDYRRSRRPPPWNRNPSDAPWSSLTVAPSNTYSMTFSATGYGSQTVNNVVVTAGHATTENQALTALPGVISGNVTDATASGHPVLAGVSVSCTCQGTAVTTNGSGNYSFPTVAAGTYSLTFTDPGWVTLTINNVSVTAGNTTTKNAALVEDGNLNGNVTDATTSATITGATVTCSCQVGTATTDGRATTPSPTLRRGDYSLTFSDTGYVTLVVNNVAVVAGTTTTTNAALTEDGSISGNVTDATASGNPPLSGVTVTCSCQVATATTAAPVTIVPQRRAGDVLAHLRPFRLCHLDDQQRRRLLRQPHEREHRADAGWWIQRDGDRLEQHPLQGVTVTCNGCGVSSATTAC